MNKVCQAIKPIFDMVPPDIFSDDPEELIALAQVGQIFRGMDKRTLHNTVRLLTGSAADFLDDYFESDIVKGYLASSSIIGTKVGPRSQGSGLVLLFHSMGEHDGEFGAWAFHKKGNGGFTQVLARAATSFGAEIRLESPVDSRHHQGRPRDRRRAHRRHRVLRRHRRLARSTRGARSSSSSSRASCPSDLVESIERFRFQGTSSKVNFALDGLPEYPALPGRGDIFRGFTERRPVDRLPRARVRRGQVRLVQLAPVHRRRDPVDHRPGHGASRQARHVVASSTTRRTSCARATGTPRRRTWATPCSGRSSRSSRASASSCSSARSSRRSHIERTVGLSEGNIFAGEFFAPQMFFFRPAPGWSQYRTPIDGYYQCGSGTHPGGCVTGAPGKLAAGQILKDRAKTKARA